LNNLLELFFNNVSLLILTIFMYVLLFFCFIFFVNYLEKLLNNSKNLKKYFFILCLLSSILLHFQVFSFLTLILSLFIVSLILSFKISVKKLFKPLFFFSLLIISSFFLSLFLDKINFFEQVLSFYNTSFNILCNYVFVEETGLLLNPIFPYYFFLIISGFLLPFELVCTYFNFNNFDLKQVFLTSFIITGFFYVLFFELNLIYSLGFNLKYSFLFLFFSLLQEIFIFFKNNILFNKN